MSFTRIRNQTELTVDCVSPVSAISEQHKLILPNREFEPVSGSDETDHKEVSIQNNDDIDENIDKNDLQDITFQEPAATDNARLRLEPMTVYEWIIGWHWYRIQPSRAIANAGIIAFCLAGIVLGVVYQMYTVLLASVSVGLLVILTFALEAKGYLSFYDELRKFRRKEMFLSFLRSLRKVETQNYLHENARKNLTQADLERMWYITRKEWDAAVKRQR